MSHKQYVIADLHFSHLNMALKRGFSSMEEHDQHIVDRWNSVVRKKDTVWILGDITMEKTSPYHLLDKLNGYKKVVLGNHDNGNHIPELLKHVNSVCGMVKHKGFLLTHCPVHESQLERYDANIHGHVHENSLEDYRYINVSAEVLDYTPVEIDALKEVFLPIPNYEGLYEISNHGRVKSLAGKEERILKNRTGGNTKYQAVILSKNGVPESCRVHSLVAKVFMGHVPCGHELVIDHKNSIATYNYLWNLQIISQRENVEKIKRLGKDGYRKVNSKY